MSQRIKADRQRYVRSAPSKTSQNNVEQNVVGELSTWDHLPSRTDLGISDAERDLIMNLQEQSGVPGFILYGIWKNESDLLSGGWHESRPWVPAKSIIEPGSRCRKARGNLCFRTWDALRSVCAQKRRDGTVVCNPDEVWVSWTGAMGPTQHMPRPFIQSRDGQWKDYITDYNGDGVYNPHDLEDALATTAAVLQLGTKRFGTIQAAVQAYAGNTAHDHYAKVVRVYRPQWCAVDGYCN